MILEDNLKLAEYVKSTNKTETGIAFIVAGAVKSKVNQQRIDRDVDIEKHKKMYRGKHTLYFNKRKDEPNEVFAARKSNAVIPNYCKFIVDLGTKFTYGRPEKVRRQFSTNKETERQMRKIEKLIGVQKLMLKIKRQASICGEQVVRLIPLDERTGDQVKVSATTTTYPHPILLDPEFTFVLRNAWDKIVAVVIEDKHKDWVKNEEVSTIELIVEDSRWRWEDGVLKKSGKNEYTLREEFIFFENNDLVTDDIQSILGLQIKLDEALTDAAHFFEKHGWPQMVSRVDLSSVISSPGYIWEISSDADGKSVLDDIDFLTWDGKMKEAREYMKMLEAAVFKISSTAPIATGDLEGIGQLRSGAGIVSAYGPSIQGATEKQVIWEENEKRFFQAIAELDSRFHGQSVINRFKDLDVEITFPDDFVPGEELVRAEVDAMAMNAHITTIRDVLRKKHPTATEERINELRQEVLDDSEALVDSKRMFITEKGGEEDKPIDSSKKKSNQQKKE